MQCVHKAAAWCCSSIVILLLSILASPDTIGESIFSPLATTSFWIPFPLLRLINIHDDFYVGDKQYLLHPSRHPPAIGWWWYGGIPCYKLVLHVLCRHPACVSLQDDVLLFEFPLSLENYLCKHVKPSMWQIRDKVGLPETFATTTKCFLIVAKYGDMVASKYNVLLEGTKLGCRRTRRAVSPLIRRPFLSH